MKRRTQFVIALTIIALIALGGVMTASAQDSTYFNSFDDNELIGWKVDSGWSVDAGQLFGTFGEAIYTDQQWEDQVFTFVVTSLSGQATALLRYNGSESLAIRMSTSTSFTAQTGLVLELVRETTFNEGTGLGRAVITTPLGGEFSGLSIEVEAIGDQVRVVANGQTVIEATDKQPLPAGWIGFRSLNESVVAIDEVSVSPVGEIEQPSDNIDLAVNKVGIEQFQRGSTIIVFQITVANRGTDQSGGFELLLTDQQDGISSSIPIGPLDGGESRPVTLSLEGPDGWQETRRQFTVTLDPAGLLLDANRDNNTFTTDPVDVPLLTSSNPVPGPASSGGSSGINPVLLVGGVALGVFGMGAVAIATFLALRQQIKIGERRKYEKMAQKGKPPDTCTPPGIHVEVEASLDFRPAHITEIVLTAKDKGRDSVRRKESIKGGINNTLKLAIVDHWLRTQNADTPGRASEVAKGINKTLVEMFMRESGRCDLAISAHLEGIELTSTFTLYRCVKQGAGNVWKKVMKWEKSISQERDDVIAQLRDRDPQATLPPGGFSTELTPLVRTYIEKY